MRKAGTILHLSECLEFHCFEIYQFEDFETEFHSNAK